MLSATRPGVEKSPIPAYEWGDHEDEVGLHITASVEPLQSVQETSNPQSVITMENAMLDIPLSREYWIGAGSMVESRRMWSSISLIWSTIWIKRSSSCSRTSVCLKIRIRRSIFWRIESSKCGLMWWLIEGVTHRTRERKKRRTRCWTRRTLRTSSSRQHWRIWKRSIIIWSWSWTRRSRSSIRARRRQRKKPRRSSSSWNSWRMP